GLNTLAGGGTFLTFPALIYTGVPPVAANATSAIAVFPGYLGGAIGFKNEIAAYDGKRLLRIVVFTAVGGLMGSALLLVSSNEAFSVMVPFLLAAATLAFAFGDRIQAWIQRHRIGKPEGPAGTLLVSIYGGYFNGGLGIVLLALFSLWGMRDLNTMNGLKNGLSFVLSVVSVVTFSLAGLVAWPQAAVMMLAATVGGYLGAPLARIVPRTVIRGLVIGIGILMSAIFLLRIP
ncbi:MAG: sulfite exporter TauE/SafE family protein, partial [Parvibaculaceae bacterium]